MNYDDRNILDVLENKTEDMGDMTGCEGEKAPEAGLADGELCNANEDNDGPQEEKGRGKKALLITVILVLIAGAAGYFIYNKKHEDILKAYLATDKIYAGVSVNGIDVGGLSKEGAAAVLEASVQEAEEKPLITVKFRGESWLITNTDIHARYDTEGAAEEAFGTGRTGKLRERYELVKGLRASPVNITMDIEFDEGKLAQRVGEICADIDREPVDAVIKHEDGRFVITEEQIGLNTDQKTALIEIKSMISDGGGGEYEPMVTSEPPALTKEEAEKATSLLGGYSTKFNSGEWGRNENIKLASKNINGTVLMPGEVFSSYKGMGEQTLENGYKFAGVIEGGVLTSGVGGGVCQVSTTLYNAVVLSELEVVERKGHSLAVGYVPLGMDAAIAGTYTDFKFKNNTEHPVYIETYVEDYRMYANIYGFESREPGRRVEFETVYLKSVAKPAEKVTVDPELPEGERIVTKKGYNGAKVEVYKLVYMDDQLQSRTWFSESSYKSVADEVTVGGSESAQAQPAAGSVTPTEPPAEPPTEPPAEPPTEPLSETGGDGMEGMRFRLIVDESGEEMYIPF